ncbi:MAG: uracil-DNA glycosylase [FCB group bacterium]|nr:uracil-DNA glycosylase [FCB group bacterium]
MSSGNKNIYEQLYRALSHQIEMGMDEVIVSKSDPQQKLSSNKQTISPLMGIEMDLFAQNTKKDEPHYESLEAHCQAVRDCQLCPLAKTRHKFVYGTGNPHADIMFIGEAPGADEDRLGEPFVGRAGQLLDRILAAIQFSRSDVYIANILKCRPPNNRDPLPEEMEKCFPYLYEQVRLIQPKLICALGRIATQALLKTSTPLGRLRKRWHDFEGIPLLATYHPAALLRFQAYKKDTWEDMKMLKARWSDL